MGLHGIKLVTFDVTNTLLKFRVPPWKYYAMTAGDHGYQITNHDCVKLTLSNSFKVMSKMYPNYGKSTIAWEDWWRRVVNLTFKGLIPADVDTDPIANKLIDEFKTSKCWSIAKGVDTLVRLLKVQGLAVGVISNFDPRLKDILHNLDLYKHFDFIVTSYDTGFSKPDIRIFNVALGMFNGSVYPSEALHIGDDVKNDYEGARAAGWHSLLINPNINTETPPANKHVFKTLEDLSTSIALNNFTL